MKRQQRCVFETVCGNVFLQSEPLEKTRGFFIGDRIAVAHHADPAVTAGMLALVFTGVQQKDFPIADITGNLDRAEQVFNRAAAAYRVSQKPGDFRNWRQLAADFAGYIKRTLNSALQADTVFNQQLIFGINGFDFLTANFTAYQLRPSQRVSSTCEDNSLILR